MARRRVLVDVSPLRDTVIERAVRGIPSERRVGIASALRELVAAVGAGQLPRD